MVQGRGSKESWRASQETEGRIHRKAEGGAKGRLNARLIRKSGPYDKLYTICRPQKFWCNFFFSLNISAYQVQGFPSVSIVVYYFIQIMRYMFLWYGHLHVNFRCIYFLLKMVVRPKHVADNFNEITAFRYWIWQADLLASSFAIALLMVVPEGSKLVHLGAPLGTHFGSQGHGAAGRIRTSVKNKKKLITTSEIEHATFRFVSCMYVPFNKSWTNERIFTKPSINIMAS
jgi:hypothetical protein